MKSLDCSEQRGDVPTAWSRKIGMLLFVRVK